ncbi:MAG: molybdopterin-dependent oxidoreductase, partial [Desulfomonilia bacterium]
MGQWRKTGCVLCAQNCGLEVLVENNRIVKVKGDRENPRSRGYVCRKGLNITYHQHHAQRLTHPLKRIGGTFKKISWDQAAKEIAEKLKEIVDEHGPRSFAYMGGGGQGCHFEAAFGVRLLRALGSRYHYSPLAQELTGIFWAHGRMTGRQYLFTIPDEERTDMLLAVGWNGMQSHQMPRAPLVLKEIAKDPDRILVVIDPRRSETAEIADIHLAVRPGTDAL